MNELKQLYNLEIFWGNMSLSGNLCSEMSSKALPETSRKCENDANNTLSEQNNSSF